MPFCFTSLIRQYTSVTLKVETVFKGSTVSPLGQVLRERSLTLNSLDEMENSIDAVTTPDSFLLKTTLK